MGLGGNLHFLRLNQGALLVFTSSSKQTYTSANAPSANDFNKFKGKTALVKRLVFSSALYNKRQQKYIFTQYSNIINLMQETNIQYNNNNIHNTTKQLMTIQQ